MKHETLTCLTLFTLTCLATAQSRHEVAPDHRRAYPLNTIVAVTTDGLWFPDSNSATPLLHIPASGFPGAAGTAGALKRPAIEWDRRTDTFLVSSGPQLFRVRVADLSPPSWFIEDLTPEPSITLDLWDLDVHPGTGELFLLDQTNNEVLRFSPPFAQGMLTTLVLPVPPTSRSMAVDSCSYPSAVILTETSQTTRVEFDGTAVPLNFFSAGRGCDQDPQYPGHAGSYMVATNTDRVARAASSPNLVIDLNLFTSGDIFGTCVPLVLAPTDVEWNPIKPRAYVFAEDGIHISPECVGAMPATGPNHIVRFPIAQVFPKVVPQLMTYAGGSGMTGSSGDLTLVLGDFAFMSPYGGGCSGGSASAIRLDSNTIPRLGTTALKFDVENAAPQSAVQLIVGLTSTQIPLIGGCDMLVTPDLIEFVGTTNAQGKLAFTWILPFVPTAGFELFAQVAVDNGGVQELTQALQIHFGK
jgi:hypothetical protein